MSRTGRVVSTGPRSQPPGVDFAIIKATEGSTERRRVVSPQSGTVPAVPASTSPPITSHIRGSRATAAARSASGATHGREAHFFLRNANLSQKDLIPALDLELSGGLRPAELRDWTMTFLVTVQHAIGAKPMVYSTASFWRSYLGDTTNIARAGFDVLWVAHWDARTPDVPGRKWLGRGWTFWQWTDCGRVPGIYDCVDRNTYTSTRPLKTLRIHRQQVRRR